MTVSKTRRVVPHVSRRLARLRLQILQQIMPINVHVLVNTRIAAYTDNTVHTCAKHIEAKGRDYEIPDAHDYGDQGRRVGGLDVSLCYHDPSP